MLGIGLVSRSLAHFGGIISTSLKSDSCQRFMKGPFRTSGINEPQIEMPDHRLRDQIVRVRKQTGLWTPEKLYKHRTSEPNLPELTHSTQHVSEVTPCKIINVLLNIPTVSTTLSLAQGQTNPNGSLRHRCSRSNGRNFAGDSTGLIM